MLHPEAVALLQKERYTSCFFLDLLLVVAGDLVVLVGRRHCLELVKSQKA